MFEVTGRQFKWRLQGVTSDSCGESMRFYTINQIKKSMIVIKPNKMTLFCTGVQLTDRDITNLFCRKTSQLLAT